ncbi:exopolysaccharide biosynthesis protein [Lysobacter sp. GX 14042]|uniref:exopolysaccharide biosynthesis protein n=1 Tax=Lysobacter sp. GX 14042 TaxID=2907155 RepID=UPI001F1F993F|nr:exopolysaccharide biosynthesis protein [Lysobacter sp. GX 14042]MCE7031652.1 exopolysaccharide biosynthesis protein [Lysobacter sp. GX 14042]
MTTTPDPGRDEAGTRALLDALADGGDPAQVVDLRQVFGGLGRRAFGMLLFIATLPAFIPVPGLAGAASGPLVMLIGAQLLLGRPVPWVPGAIGRRGPKRRSLRRFRDRISPWLARLEKHISPRNPELLDHRLATAWTGLLLLLLGLLLALPIPFTNYVFGLLLLLFALALLERDGRLMAVAWTLGVLAVGASALLSGQVAAWAASLLDLVV